MSYIFPGSIKLNFAEEEVEDFWSSPTPAQMGSIVKALTLSCAHVYKSNVEYKLQKKSFFLGPSFGFGQQIVLSQNKTSGHT